MRSLAAGFAVLGLLLPATGIAGPILQPVSVTTTAPLLGGHPLNAGNDQSGLSAGYTSGVTDFDIYIASNPTHDNDANTNFATALGVTTAVLDFDLGGPTVIESMALWNRTLTSQGVKDFTLIASDVATFATSTLLGDFLATARLGTISNKTEAEVFSVAPTSASFVRMSVTSIYGTCCVSFGEVAFEEVPEPSTALLLGIGVAALGAMRRRAA